MSSGFSRAVWKGPGRAGRVPAGFIIGVNVVEGTTARVGLAEVSGVGNLAREGETCEQADNKKASRIRIPLNLRRTILNP